MNFSEIQKVLKQKLQISALGQDIVQVKLHLPPVLNAFLESDLEINQALIEVVLKSLIKR